MRHDEFGTDEFGTLVERDGKWVLEFIRRLPHPPEKVWKAVTEPEHLKAWFPQKIVGERRAGSPLRFVGSHGDGFDGEMVAFEPPALMELTWGTDRLRIELRADGDGTMLTLIDEFDELGKAARDAAGWHECLDQLIGHLDGRPPLEWGERWREVHPGYVDRLGPEASTTGPPAGYGRMR